MIPIEKYKVIRDRIMKEKGDLTFFGLILREDAPGTWDLVISAPWAESDQLAALQLISDIVKAELDLAELLQLSRVVILERESPVLHAFLSALPVKENSVAEFRESMVGGIRFRHAYILEAKQLAAEGAAAR
jgi:hypothetical protein